MPRKPTYRTEYGYEFKRDYDEGYADGFEDARRELEQMRRPARRRSPSRAKPKKTIRKKSKWQIFMGQKKNQIKLRNGKLNLKKMGVAYRKKNKK